VLKFIKIAKRAGASKEEIGEAIIAARFALASTVFASATEGWSILRMRLKGKNENSPLRPGAYLRWAE
jgi:alkylhydroperoxidase/carboxymuconolactone decarboxylase family protein YurZ